MLSVPVWLFLSKRDSFKEVVAVAPCNLRVEKETEGQADWCDRVVTSGHPCLEWLSQGNRDTITQVHIKTSRSKTREWDER